MIQFKCMQLSKVEKEEYRINMVKKHLPWFPRYLLLKVFFLKVLMIFEVHNI
jgi:hypothetical protein